MFIATRHHQISYRESTTDLHNLRFPTNLKTRGGLAVSGTAIGDDKVCLEPGNCEFGAPRPTPRQNLRMA